MVRTRNYRKENILFSLLFLTCAFFWAGRADAFILNVVGADGGNVGSYRWLLEEDVTYKVNPAVTDPDPLAVNFHKSYMPVASKGTGTGSTDITVDTAKHYFVSVLPDSGYAMGGAQVPPGVVDQIITVTVQELPLPTAQITILVFEDTTINGIPDIPEEQGLEGFDILLFDAGGRYGVSGGQVSQDAFGNPLGTTYDTNGNVLTTGTGIIKTGADGSAAIKYLAPGKYGIQAVPSAGEGWVQTSTIEGTKTIDAWVKANEPPYFMEFGPPGWHVFIGFVKPTLDATALTGGATLSGTVVNLHLSRPPDFAFYDGVAFDHTTAWIGLNSLGTGIGTGIYAQRANADGTFSIPNVPPGNYQLVVWDDNLDLIIAFLGVTVNADGSCNTPNESCNFENVPVFQWFSRLHSYVFNDLDADGFWDEGEPAIPEQNINVRFRDGSLYQSMATDGEGAAPIDEVFPFFSWLVAEVDYARYEATGVTVVVDAGGPIDLGDGWAIDGLLNPQLQPENADAKYRTETGPVLAEAFQGFLGQTSVLMWGKKAYDAGENGGISGIVYYATTRGENDARQAVADPWEPGIPRVQVNLYKDADMDGVIDDNDASGTVDLADVDNYPYEDFPGAGDIDRNVNGVFDMGDAVQYVHTDSWDDSMPEDCPGDAADPFYMGGKCYDGMRNWNQVRPGVFDGGYAFTGLSAGTYIVEAVPPTEYEIVKEEDKNVDFGETYTPSPLLLPPICVGDSHTVPAQLTLFPGVDAPYANTSRPLCDRKQVYLTDGKNAAADFFMFTEVPVAGHIAGMILVDNANEFDPASPQFGEKYAPPYVPISIRDWTGLEYARVYSDQWGRFNALVPSTFTMNLPMPSGASPNMVTTCMNDPGPIYASGAWIQDPYYKKQYSQFCYTFQYMPGTITYLDTPVVSIAAFAGPDQYPLDCEFEDGTPRIYQVTNTSGGGPYVSSTGQEIEIHSVGEATVPNPMYGPLGSPDMTITRDYGFGSDTGTGSVTLGSTPLEIEAWTSDMILATVPAGAVTGQLTVKRGDNGKSTIAGVTVTVGPYSGTVRNVPNGGDIQSHIDNADPGDLILVPPGRYEELVIMWKPVKLQGWGEGSTTIVPVKTPAEKLNTWRENVQNLITNGSVDLLPGQETGFEGIEPVTLFNEEGPGIIVLAKDAKVSKGGFGTRKGIRNSRIDGFTITGGDSAGGIMVNGYAHYLEISNNRITGNSGTFGGGIRIGHTAVTTGEEYVSGENDHISIHNNNVNQNGGLNGAGGGISLYTGTDDYEVTKNYVCGNFTLGDGGGIGHLGLSENGVISNNTIIFNQSFYQMQTVNGGGIFVGGGAPLAVGGLSEGSGSVKILSNLITGNNSGAGDGGGIRLSRVSGQDVEKNNDPKNWHTVNIFNNILTNNVAGLAGGGISLQDSLMVNILHNTIANNDSTATAGEAFSPGSPDQSNAQPAGIVSRTNSAELEAAIGKSKKLDAYREFSNPTLKNNIILNNRSFYFLVDANADPTGYLLRPDVANGEDAVFWDLAVLGTATAKQLNPMYCLLTDTTGYDASNRTGEPMFVYEYFNGAQSSVVNPEPTTAIQPAVAFDEGGNFIEVHYGPLTLNPQTGAIDYHIQGGSASTESGDSAIVKTYTELGKDYDGDTRPTPTATMPDIGADEIQ
jgi:hypothetical protein